MKRVERWRNSGLSAKDFANEIGVNENTLKNWSWRVAAEERAAERAAPLARVARTEDKPLHFVEVTTAMAAPSAAEPAASPPPVSSEKLELVLPSGMTVRVPSSFEPATLRRLLTVVG